MSIFAVLHGWPTSHPSVLVAPAPTADAAAFAATREYYVAVTKTVRSRALVSRARAAHQALRLNFPTPQAECEAWDAYQRALRIHTRDRMEEGTAYAKLRDAVQLAEGFEESEMVG